GGEEGARPGGGAGAHRCEGRAAVERDPREVRDGLDVVDDRGSAVEADGGRKVRGLEAREAALALEALEQGCFLATDVGAGTWVDHEVDRPSGVEDVS